MTRVLWLLFVVVFAAYVTAFNPAPRRCRQVRTCSGLSPLKSLLEEVEETERTTECLNLEGEFSLESTVAPLATPRKVLEFFQISEHRNCLVTAGKSRLCSAFSPSPEIFRLWVERARITGGTKPTESDVVLQVTTGEINFSGLSLTSMVWIGSKLVPSSASNPFPQYEFVLIRDEQQVSGFKPLVWVYNQLTGASKSSSAEKADSPLSISRLSAKLSSDEEGIVFQSEGYLKVAIKFPSFLLKILPVSKEKAEAQGSKSIKKAIEKDGTAGLLAFRDLYEAWIIP